MVIQWIHPFCSDWIFGLFLYSSFHADSHRFVGVDNRSIFGMMFPNIAAGYVAVIYWCCARHCCWHRNFQLFLSGFYCEFEFFVVWFNEEYSSQLSGTDAFLFLDSPSLFCFLFRCIGHMLPHIWPYMIRTRSSLFPRKSLFPDDVYPSGDVSFSRTNLVNPCNVSDHSLSPSTFQQSSIFSPTIHPVMYMLFW